MNDDCTHVTAAAVAIEAGQTAPDWIMYLPAGEHVVYASEDGKPAERKYTIDRGVSEVLQASLTTAVQAGGPPPYFGFDHVDGRAAAWPQEFAWRDSGVWARVTWTPAGAAAVTIRAAGQLPEYRFFSPSFRRDRRSGKITGIWPSEAGSLVNNPAFRGIARVAAKQAVSAIPADQTNEPNKMKKDLIAEAAVRCGLLTAEEAAGDTAGTLLESRYTEARSAVSVKASQATELATVKARAETAEAALQTHREAAADARITAAVGDGRIPPKDEETKTFWRNSLLTGGDSAVKALEALPKRIPTDSGATSPGVKTEAAQAGADDDRSKRVCAKAHEIQRTTPGLAWSVAHRQADEMTPRN